MMARPRAKPAQIRRRDHHRSCLLNHPRGRCHRRRRQPKRPRNRSESEGPIIRGVEITIRGEELIGKSDERIRVRQEAIAALDARIERRAGDLPFDTRADDWTTVPKLETERRVHRDTVLRVSLIRNGPRPQELYSLSVADLRLAGVVAFDKNDARVSATAGTSAATTRSSTG